MNKNIKSITNVFILILMQEFMVFAQKDINIIAHRDEDKIQLRWAPKDASIWYYGLKYGYILEKYEVSKSNPKVYYSQKTINDGHAFVIASDSTWSRLCNSKNENAEKYASIAAQAIFGNTFETMHASSNSIINIHNKVKEQQNKFTFSMFSADQCWDVALASGLAYADTDIEKTKNYFYKIFLNHTEYNIQCDTGYVFVNNDTLYSLPKPRPLRIEIKNTVVLLKWKNKNQAHLYNSYILEKSYHDNDFKPVTETPIVPIIKENSKNEWIFYTDSIAHTTESVKYRLKGHTPFDMEGPYSDVVVGKVKRKLQVTPLIKEIKELENFISIKWHFENDNIKKFMIYRSPSMNGTYELIMENVNRFERSFVDSFPLPSNYYIVTAVNNDQMYSSLPKFVQISDSLPPVKPARLEAIIDSIGRVSLIWKSNLEIDLLGYRIFRSNYRQHEYSQITSSPQQDTVFYDSININTLTDSIYYKIQATDIRYNNSEFSSVIAIGRPDHITPVSPSFKIVKNTYKGVRLKWEPSTSIDVSHQLLYRKAFEDSLWILISKMDNHASSFEDTTGLHEVYNYTLIAVDKNGNESEPAKPVTAQKLTDFSKPDITKLFIEADREAGNIILRWYDEKPNSGAYAIYRAVNDEPLTWYTTIEGNHKRFYDKDIVVGNRYRYGIKNNAHSYKALITSIKIDF